MEAEIGKHIVLVRFSGSRTRRNRTLSCGESPFLPTAGTNVIKGASAHFRCGSMVPYLGETATKVPPGKPGIYRSRRQGECLAHLGGGLPFHDLALDPEAARGVLVDSRS
jgi:hypothetical protein